MKSLLRTMLSLTAAAALAVAAAQTPATKAAPAAAKDAVKAKAPKAPKAQPAPAPTAAEIADAKSKGMVWVNLNTKVFHKDGEFYGKTKSGKFMAEADATKAGFHAAKPSPVKKAKVAPAAKAKDAATAKK